MAMPIPISIFDSPAQVIKKLTPPLMANAPNTLVLLSRTALGEHLDGKTVLSWTAEDLHGLCIPDYEIASVLAIVEQCKPQPEDIVVHAHWSADAVYHTLKLTRGLYCAPRILRIHDVDGKHFCNILTRFEMEHWGIPHEEILALLIIVMHSASPAVKKSMERT